MFVLQEWDEDAAKAVRAPWMLCWDAAGLPLWLDTSSGERLPYVKDGSHPTKAIIDMELATGIFRDKPIHFLVHQ